MRSIVVIGGGFAGLWSAVGAARKLDELGIGPDQVEVTLINRDAWHGIRVRNYESDLSDLRVPLDSVLEPADIRRIVAEGKIASLMGLEGGHIIEDKLSALRTFFRLGVRYMTLTHSFHMQPYGLKLP